MEESKGKYHSVNRSQRRNQSIDDVYEDEAMRQHSFVGDAFESENVTIEEAFEKVGGFGKFQIYSTVMNTLTNMGAAFFLYAFAFLEKEPNFKCQLTPGSDEWTFGTEEAPLEEAYCAGEYYCEIDWSDP